MDDKQRNAAHQRLFRERQKVRALKGDPMIAKIELLPRLHNYYGGDTPDEADWLDLVPKVARILEPKAKFVTFSEGEAQVTVHRTGVIEFGGWMMCCDQPGHNWCHCNDKGIPLKPRGPVPLSMQTDILRVVVHDVMDQVDAQPASGDGEVDPVFAQAMRYVLGFLLFPVGEA